uniref:NAC transcription factor 21 n=1 Tax=Litchi chinensis TaxID=151069 RepID=A0A8K1MBY6_LITCN|nr:NAC transcription factor 21 [Litchi chinensis]
MGSIVGYRFHPTPEELINHYLRKKRLNPDFSSKKIKEVDLYKYEPSELPGLLPGQADDQDWHFFCEPDYKYGKSKRVNRRTRGGNWKVTGKKRDVKDKRKRVIGWKITLVFYEGSGNFKEARTNWVMHEYHIKDDSGFKREFVVVRIRRNPNTKCNAPLTPNGGVPSTDMASNSGNHDPEITAFQVESQFRQEPQPPANHEISFDRTSQLLPNHGFSQNRESTQSVPDRVLYENAQLPPNYNEQVNDGRNSQSAFESEFYGQETGHTHPHSVPEDSGPKSQSTVQSEFYGQEIGHSLPLREQEDDKRNSQLAVQTEFYGQEEVGHSHPTDFNLSKPVTGDSLYYGSDEAIAALNDGSAETIAALLYGFSPMAYEYDFNSMCQSQVYPPDENIPPVSMGSVV